MHTSPLSTEYARETIQFIHMVFCYNVFSIFQRTPKSQDIVQSIFHNFSFYTFNVMIHSKNGWMNKWEYGKKGKQSVFQHFCQLLIISYYNIDRWEEKQQKGNESHGATLVPLNSWTRSTKELEISRNGGESNNRVMYWSVKSWPDSVVIAREKGRKNRSGQQIPSIVPSALVRGNCLKSAQFISSQSQKFF